MPKFALHAETLDSLAVQGLADDELSTYFRLHPNAPDIDAWLLSPLRQRTLAGQRLLRIARHANAFRDRLDGSVQILFGVPLAVFPNSVEFIDWLPIHRELEPGLAHAWDLGVRMCARPVPVEALHGQGATQWARWMDCLTGSLSGAPDPTDGMATPPRPGAWVWVGQVTAPTLSPWVENLFFRTTAEASRAFRLLGLRLDALMEEQGLPTQALPPSGLWNALSISRLGTIRATLQRFRRDEPVSVQVDAGALVVTFGGAEHLRVPVPEETSADLEHVLQWHRGRRKDE